MSHQWRALTVLVAVTGFLAASLLTYVDRAKSVVLIVDGQMEKVATMTTTVGDLLAHADIRTNPRDQVLPSPNTELTEHAVVEVRFARPITLDVDGQVSTHFVTALTVDGALREIGVAADAWVNRPRTEQVTVEGASLAVRVPKRVVVSVAGKKTAIVTTSPHVRGALKEAGVTLGELDRVNAQLSAPLHKGMLISVTRVKQGRVTKVEKIKHTSKKIYDKTMLEYKRVTKSQGRDGLKRTTYLVTYENGRAVKRQVVQSTVVTPPKTAVVVIGTKKRTLEQLNWARLAKCESHANPKAVSRGGLYHGLFQFSLTAWKSVGGTGKPSQASADEQLMRAKLLYVKRGASPWPHCGRLLFTD